MMDHILVVQLAKLGDFIQAGSLLANIRSLNPQANLLLLARDPSVVEAAGFSPLVDEVLIAPEAALSFGHFKAVYVLNSHPEAARVGGAISCDEYYGPRLVEDALVYPPAQRFLMALMRKSRKLSRFNLVDVWASLRYEAKPFPTSWPRRYRRKGSAAGARKKLVGFQLGCRNHLRRWPVEYFVRLAENLLNQGHDFTPVLLGAGSETVLAKKFKTLWGENDSVDLVGATDLRSLSEAIGELELLVSGDTGVMHLAAALNVPVLALFFGPAYGPETGPYGNGHLIYQAEASCAPCLENSPCRNRQCLDMPRPELAAVCAGWLLDRAAAEELSSAFPIFDPPSGHRLWQTSLGSFGQDLFPVDNSILTAEEALALLLTEAGRCLMRPSHKFDLLEFNRNLSQFQGRSERPSLDALKRIVKDCFIGHADARLAFMENIQLIADSAGLEFA